LIFRHTVKPGKLCERSGEKEGELGNTIGDHRKKEDWDTKIVITRFRKGVLL